MGKRREGKGKKGRSKAGNQDGGHHRSPFEGISAFEDGKRSAAPPFRPLVMM
jgi:hypothetical protein